MDRKMEKYFDQYKILDKFLIVTIKNWIIKNKSLIVSTDFGIEHLILLFLYI